MPTDGWETVETLEGLITKAVREGVGDNPMGADFHHKFSERSPNC